MSKHPLLQFLAYTLDVASVTAVLLGGSGMWFLYYCTLHNISLKAMPKIGNFSPAALIIFAEVFGLLGGTLLITRYNQIIEQRFPFVFQWKLPLLLFLILFAAPLMLTHLKGG